ERRQAVQDRPQGGAQGDQGGQADGAQGGVQPAPRAQQHAVRLGLGRRRHADRPCRRGVRGLTAQAPRAPRPQKERQSKGKKRSQAGAEPPSAPAWLLPPYAVLVRPWRLGGSTFSHSGITSPPARVPSARQVAGATLLLTKRTEPSRSRALTPP